MPTPTVKRNALGQLTKGTGQLAIKGNTTKLKELKRRLEEEVVDDAIDELKEMLKDQSPKIRKDAVYLALEYGLGKPKTQVEHTGVNGEPIEFRDSAREKLAGLLLKFAGVTVPVERQVIDMEPIPEPPFHRPKGWLPPISVELKDQDLSSHRIGQKIGGQSLLGRIKTIDEKRGEHLENDPPTSPSEPTPG